MMATYLDVEGLIVDRLAERVTELPAAHILTLADAASIEEIQQPVPGLSVIFNGQYPRKAPNGALTQVIDQQWQIVVVIRHVASLTDGRAARAMVSPILAAVDAAMLGWEPTQEHDPFQLVGAPESTYRNGFLNYPLVYQTSYTARGVR